MTGAVQAKPRRKIIPPSQRRTLIFGKNVYSIRYGLALQLEPTADRTRPALSVKSSELRRLNAEPLQRS
jgi:hypothetical protein